ncbi:MAG: glycosyltransferase family 39 protein [Chloroflexi bacterium]|nr:glycosyltransferase family 39 protein [Chloroflexota bacterium]
MRPPLTFAAILLLAAALRLYGLDRIPPGLYHDEAYNGLDAQAVLAGNLPIFFEANHGRQPLFIYLQAGAVALLGPTREALRGTSAVVGILTVFSIYFLARELAPDASRARRLGLLAAGLLAVLYWHVHFSRTGFRPILFPLVVTWSLYFFWRAYRRGRWRDYALAGVGVAAALYTYTAGALLPVLLGAFGLAHVLQRDEGSRRLARGLLLLYATALVVAAPLLLFYASRPEMALGRPAFVSVFNPDYAAQGPVVTAAQNLLRSAGMFFWEGDHNWRHNVSGWPLLDPLSQALLVAGIALAAWRWREPAHQLLLLTAGIMLLPTVFSAEEVPHASRAYGMLPAVAVLMALGAEAVLHGTQGFVRRWAWRRPLAGAGVLCHRRAFPAAAIVLVLAIGVTTVHRYFFVWGPHMETYQTFDSEVYEMALYLRGHPELYADTAVIWAGFPGVGPLTTLQFLAPEAASRVALLEASHGLSPGQAGELPVLYAVTASYPFQPRDLASLLAQARVPGELPPRPDGGVAFHVFRLEATTPVPAPAYEPPLRIPANLASLLELRGAEIQAGLPWGPETLVTLLWRPLATADPGHHLFVQLLDGRDRVRGQTHIPFPSGPSSDSPGPIGGVAWLAVPLDQAAPTSTYRFALGLSAEKGGPALPVMQSEGQVVGNRVILGQIELSPRSRGRGQLDQLRKEGQVSRVAAPGLALAGARLGQRDALPGERLSLAVYWEGGEAPLPDYTARLSLLDSAGRTAQEMLTPVGDGIAPPSTWQRRDVVEDLVELSLRASLAPGTYTLRVSIEGEPGSGALNLGQVRIGQRDYRTQLPTLACCRLDRALQQLATLALVDSGRPSAAGSTTARPGETLDLKLYWQAREETAQSYKAFVHLVDAAGRLVAQHDSVPGLGDWPTTGWVPGEVVEDPHPLALPATLLPGRYRLLAGLYDEATGRRIGTGTPDAAVEIGEVEVAATRQ